MASALLVIDVQKSFTRRPYWEETDSVPFLDRVNLLVARARRQDVPVLQIFHVDETDDAAEPFSRRSGLIEALHGLQIEPTAVFYKSVHSAMFANTSDGVGLDYWLRKRGIDHLVVTGIRTEQCCETTTRHASDLGYKVSYASDATLTFRMVSASGRIYTPAEIRERTELVLAGRFADVMSAESVRW